MIESKEFITIRIAKTDPDALSVVIILELLNVYKGGRHDGKVNVVEVLTVTMTESTQEAKNIGDRVELDCDRTCVVKWIVLAAFSRSEKCEPNPIIDESMTAIEEISQVHNNNKKKDYTYLVLSYLCVFQYSVPKNSEYLLVDVT
ncbi:hypothetical protein RFI_34245 [Reticulomyxa filosa]|uniref:Uncharacterized protein n=1 Tax=Reticulomyxa filosa TaxID=46433 RepID=X6LQZ5_RETFI|nr:hypothetical protein RFI_34245 [Reticulomyxa filosa]|eukprot:ETO03165.1 hypothetical protein RFI_34245 [Reticulomyxa filosa]